MLAGRLSRHATSSGPRWTYDGRDLPAGVGLGSLLALPAENLHAALEKMISSSSDAARDPLLAPIDPMQEVWASGVTYLRSREARKSESSVADIYERVYEAERPELFLKSIGWRVAGDGERVRIRRDSRWNVPEPELVLAINHAGEIVGYTAGNDMSSRDIEGQNPLYLPQAKIYDGSCALGPAILLCSPDELTDVTIALWIERDGAEVFSGTIRTSQMKRRFDDLARALRAEYQLPEGALLMTGTGIVPPDEFTLAAGDRVRIDVGPLSLRNPVAG